MALVTPPLPEEITGWRKEPLGIDKQNSTCSILFLDDFFFLLQTVKHQHAHFTHRQSGGWNFWLSEIQERENLIGITDHSNGKKQANC